MTDDRRIGAMPKLYGGPAYARPQGRMVKPVERPFDPDDLPLEAVRSQEEQELVQELLARPYDGAAATDGLPMEGPPAIRARPFRLRLPGISKTDNPKG